MITLPAYHKQTLRLTVIQADIYVFIMRYRDTYGCLPTIASIARGFNWQYMNAYLHVQRMMNKGVLIDQGNGKYEVDEDWGQ